MMKSTALLLLAGAVTQTAGHATMIQPMSRAWYKKIHGNCVAGGCTEPFSAGGTGGYSPCGIPAGEDFTKQDFDISSLTAQEREQHTLHAGSVLQIRSLFTAHHLGHVIYAICPDSDLAGAAYRNANPPTTVPDCATVSDPVLKQACEADYMSPLDNFAPAKALMDCFMGEGDWANGRDGAGKLLRSEDHEHLDPAPIDQAHPDRWYMPPKTYTMEDGTPGAAWPLGDTEQYYTHYFKVPSNLKCKNGKCLMFFFYWTANSCTGQGYNEYFSELVGGAYHPRKQCTGGKCSTVDARPIGQWTMHGNWWHNPTYYPHGTCDSRVNDHPTNTWARNSPERFWNCADVHGPEGGSGGTPDPCANVQCEVRDCETSYCNPTTGQCEYDGKADGTSCFKSCGACGLAKCQYHQCVCENKPEGTLCSGGNCQAGQCQPVVVSPGVPPVNGVDCVATLDCPWSDCSATCGGGTRTKACTHQVQTPQSGNGKSCDETTPLGPTVTEPCNTQDCPSPGTNNCILPEVKAWDECTPQPTGSGNPPKCCPTGYVCCGSQWSATCRQTCSAVETSFAAGKEDGEGGGGDSQKGALMGLVGLLGGVLCGGATVFAVYRNRGSRHAEEPSGV
eukprot:Hpha_TRINITY_DN16866_c4_g1::TRINITY_DN16866_c4_g1_i6::g.150436::m.150436